VPSTLSSTRAELFGIAALNEFLFIPWSTTTSTQWAKLWNVSTTMQLFLERMKTQGPHSCCLQYSNDIDIVTMFVDCTWRHLLFGTT
jgi:hypothetical protein